MKICIFSHDAYMSGANLSLKDWISEDLEDNIYIFVPHKSKDFLNLGKNVNIISGDYFAVTKGLDKTTVRSKLKNALKNMYMRLFYKNIIKKRLKKIIKKIAPDVIISNSFAIWIGADIAQSLNIPHIWYVREFMELDHRITHYNLKDIQKLTQKSNAIFISKSVYNYYKKKYRFLNTKIIYDQVNYNSDLVSYNSRFESLPVHALFVGTLEKGKGVMDAVYAVSNLYKKGCSIELDIYGEGPLKNEISRYIKSKNITNIKLKGYSTKLTALRKNYDIALICSNMEALGRVTIESMYYRNLVLGSDGGETKNLVKNNKTGFLYKNNNVDDLEKKLYKIIELSSMNTDNINSIINRAHKCSVRKFSKAIKPEIVDFIQEII